jgi:hypothetical protein
MDFTGNACIARCDAYLDSDEFKEGLGIKDALNYFNLLHPERACIKFEFGDANEDADFGKHDMNLNAENIQIGKTENDDLYYLNLMNEKCRGKLIISTTISPKNFASLNKQQIKMFHLNREYSKFIEHIFKNSECQNKPRNFIDNITLKLFLNYKIYVKLRNLTYNFQS